MDAATKRCPADGNALRAFEHAGTVVDVCHHCGGMWFELGEFAKFTKKPENLDAVESSETPEGPPPGDPGYDNCPAGHGRMERFDYQGSTGIVIDRCVTCGGIWLDDQESAAVAAQQRSAGHHALTQDQAEVVAAFDMQHISTMDRLRGSQAFFDALGKPRYWLDPSSWGNRPF